MDLDRLAFTFFNPEIAREYWPDIAKGFARLGDTSAPTSVSLHRRAMPRG